MDSSSWPKGKKNATKLKSSKQAAVLLTAVNKDGVSVAGALAKLKLKFGLRSMGIASLRPRRARMRAMIYEVPGEESQAKADNLAAKFRAELNAEDIKVARPTKTAELRLSGLDNVADGWDVADAVATVRSCGTDDVLVGTIRRPQGGLRSVWVRCPAAAARKIADAGRVRMGWMMARVEAFKPRPAQCFQ